VSESPQQGYDNVRTVTRKVGGDAKSTLMRLFEDIKNLVQLAGQDGIVTVTISAHVPSRRLPSATHDPTS